MYRNAIRLFDVSLRNGTQRPITPYNMRFNRDLLDNIISKNVKDIELGSMSSSEVSHKTNESVELFKYTKTICKDHINYYMLFHNSKNILEGLSLGVQNFSLFTSMSDVFLRKNNQKTLYETQTELDKSFQLLASKKDEVKNIKLYISCINECPIKGRISTTNIIRELVSYYYEYDDITNICLLDTCGSLKPDILEEIIHRIVLEGVDIKKISLRIQSSDNDINRMNSILDISLNNDIRQFDISLLGTENNLITHEEKNARILNYNVLHNYLYV